MRHGLKVAVVMPVLDEEPALAKVLAEVPAWVDQLLVVDNGSRDRSAAIARAAGAQVITEKRRGYGAACLAGLTQLENPDIVVFLDGDYSDRPGEMVRLVDPIALGRVDLVIGSRTLGLAEPGALLPQQRFGNFIACALIRWIWGVRYSDLGPFRAIRFAPLQSLAMGDPDYGWTVEMQIKAARCGLRVLERAVSYRPRIGRSKISGTIGGTVRAGIKIIGLILASAFDAPARPWQP
ncbi:MAG: glycosyltransferase family 2 protein [Pseudomonadota bacterium]